MKSVLMIIFLITIININVWSLTIKGTVKTSDGILEDALIYIEKIDGKTFSPPSKPAVLDQVDLTFVPHILPVIVGTSVVFPNSDATRHNVFSPSKIKKIDLGTYSPGSSKTVLFDKPGIYPILCHVHPEMSAFIIVVETPYYAISNDAGNFILKDVPAGKYKIKVWHESYEGYSQVVDVSNGKDKSINFVLND